MPDTEIELSFKEIEAGKRDSLAFLTLNRPQSSNAMNPAMIVDLLKAYETIRGHDGCRAVLLRGKGKNFCAGADLEWMRNSGKLSRAENVRESEQLFDLFNGLYRLPVPTIALVQGAAFGGGVGLAACCDFAIAVSDAKFCLSEVKVGVVAAVILQFVNQKILPGHLRRFVFGARVFSAAEAFAAGLVQRTVDPTEVDSVLREELNHILSGSPTAQRRFKAVHQTILETPERFEKRKTVMAELIGELRVSAEGQEGLGSFFDKKTPSWVMKLPPEFTI